MEAGRAAGGGASGGRADPAGRPCLFGSGRAGELGRRVGGAGGRRGQSRPGGSGAGEQRAPGAQHDLLGHVFAPFMTSQVMRTAGGGPGRGRGCVWRPSRSGGPALPFRERQGRGAGAARVVGGALPGRGYPARRWCGPARRSRSVGGSRRGAGAQLRKAVRVLRKRRARPFYALA